MVGGMILTMSALLVVPAAQHREYGIFMGFQFYGCVESVTSVCVGGGIGAEATGDASASGVHERRSMDAPPHQYSLSLH
jgi:hypothetical protein